MSKTRLTWLMVDQAGEHLGAEKAARLKWRQRRVPFEWRLRIIEHFAKAGMGLSSADFDSLPEASARIAA